MFIYNHHIRDFNNATQHLTPVEQVFYIRLIWLYYDTEKPIQNSNFDLLARKICAKTDEEKTALKAVLDEFFILQEDGYHNNRCDDEIEKFLNNLEFKSKAGKASAAARKKVRDKKKSNGLTGVQQPLNSRSTGVQQVLQAKSQKPKAKINIPNNFKISNNMKEWATRQGIHNIKDHLEPFIDACKARGYKYIDWDAAFMNAVRKDWANIGHGKPSTDNEGFQPAQ